MILACGWEELDDAWKRRAAKLLDEERISELNQAHAAGQLASAQLPAAQISIFAEDTVPVASENETHAA